MLREKPTTAGGISDSSLNTSNNVMNDNDSNNVSLLGLPEAENELQVNYLGPYVHVLIFQGTFAQNKTKI